MMRSKQHSHFKTASIIFGAFFCLLVSACGEKKSTASTSDWENSKEESKKESTEKVLVKTEATPSQKKSSQAQAPVRFLSYNLKNYLTMRRYIDGKASELPKPEEEITALIEIIKESTPDVLGVCEIGSKKDLQDLASRLKKEGIDLPHAHYVQGADKVRALAILSRYPITATATPKELGYQLNGHSFEISRGILDATIQLPNKSVRFLGVHFKSKRPIREADQEMMRRNESLLLRKHIDDILTTDADTHLIAYGDFNDTKRTKSVYTVRGRSNSKKRMEAVEVTDSRGENWTHNWKREDIYSRFDFVMTNTKLTPHIDLDGSRILDSKSWELASDHRAILVLIK